MTAIVHLDLRLDPVKLDAVPALLNEVLAATGEDRVRRATPCS